MLRSPTAQHHYMCLQQKAFNPTSSATWPCSNDDDDDAVGAEQGRHSCALSCMGHAYSAHSACNYFGMQFGNGHAFAILQYRHRLAVESPDQQVLCHTQANIAV
jgi:hypothetical protein